ncbi:K(+) efflux antiporter 5-like isoform X2 [Citrus sinensis]|uniref:K(+) efflux antiporter 5-like isoform X2 n=1 Tax=Citrus sinensis TaxID=2711 RepID=UPI000D6254AB|nr:K(+) efflux antiporter 5-like isoform X2 [Citrus sinensis]
MSSTAVVVKFLVEQSINNALHGQVTIGTLISQVETFAQFGVVFLLFALGLEFSFTKLKAVGHVAVLGGLLQIAIFMFLCGITAALAGCFVSFNFRLECYRKMILLLEFFTGSLARNLIIGILALIFGSFVG